MEVYETSDAYIVVDGHHSLWCSRSDGKLTAKRGIDLASVQNAVCLGRVYGVVGKIALDPDSQKLLLICRRTLIGRMPGGHDVYAINRIVALPLLTTDTPDLALEPCEGHNSGGPKKNEKSSPTSTSMSTTTSTTDGSPNRLQPRALPLKKTWNSIKTATSQVKQRKPKDSNRDRDKFDRRVTEELVKMFADTQSFYYSHTTDLTDSMQRQWKRRSKDNRTDDRQPSWRQVDDRFFWNRHMLRELIDLDDPLADRWIVPVLQGFVQMKSCSWNPDDDSSTVVDGERSGSRHQQSTTTTTTTSSSGDGQPKTSRPLSITLISRRSRYRAGTRYRRRGVDESGKVANYVETEQIVEYEHHVLSFVQVRGSAPVYWSQIGYKYRPPPRLDRGEQETQSAFEKHFTEELDIYGSQAVVDLVEQSGKEKVIGDAYLNHILKYDSPKLTYISFDFHEYCRGMRFENVSFLIVSIQDVIRDMLYCWADKEGIIYEQKGAFRVNCIDCLDRTNVVQTALAKAVLEIQFTKLGVVPPEGLLPFQVRNALQVMWANNGDSLSRQYAGTAALKGDYTRTGERRFAGMVKDGYNSANRYFIRLARDVYRQASIDLMLGEDGLEDLYHETCALRETISTTFTSVVWQSLTADCRTHNDLPFGPETHLVTVATALTRYYLNRFKDAHRQAAIDLMLGKSVSEEELHLNADDDDDDDDDEQHQDQAFILSQSEHIKQLIEDCKKLLVPESEVVMGGWALIDADPVSGDPGQQDADSILILTRDSYYVVSYDDEADRITSYQRVLLDDIEKIELGPEPSYFKCKYNCMRINYTVRGGQSGYFHMFRSTNVRFFNNMAVVIKSDEEALESLKAICDACLVTLQVSSISVPFVEGKLERKKSKTLNPQSLMSNPFEGVYLDNRSMVAMPRNVSEGQLMALKAAGTKAIDNVTSQFARLNPMASRRSARSAKSSAKRPSTAAATETAAPSKPQFHVASSSESDDEDVGDDRRRIEHKSDVLLDSCGILASGGARTASAAMVAAVRLTDSLEGPSPPVVDCGVKPPEIRISSEDVAVAIAAVGSPANPYKKISHSLGSIEKVNGARTETTLTTSTKSTTTEMTHSLEQPDVEASMKTSHSEGAIHSNVTTAIATASGAASAATTTTARDQLMSPLSKLAKGVQSFGMNLHRATNRGQRLASSASTSVASMTTSNATAIATADSEAGRRFRDRCLKSRTRIIRL